MTDTVFDVLKDLRDFDKKGGVTRNMPLPGPARMFKDVVIGIVDRLAKKESKDAREERTKDAVDTINLLTDEGRTKAENIKEFGPRSLDELVNGRKAEGGKAAISSDTMKKILYLNKRAKMLGTTLEEISNTATKDFKEINALCKKRPELRGIISEAKKIEDALAKEVPPLYDLMRKALKGATYDKKTGVYTGIDPNLNGVDPKKLLEAIEKARVYEQNSAAEYNEDHINMRNTLEIAAGKLISKRQTMDKDNKKKPPGRGEGMGGKRAAREADMPVAAQAAVMAADLPEEVRAALSGHDSELAAIVGGLSGAFLTAVQDIPKADEAELLGNANVSAARVAEAEIPGKGDGRAV